MAANYKQIARRAKQLGRGVTLYRAHTAPGYQGPAAFHMMTMGGGRYRGVILAGGQVVEVWDTTTADLLRRIATGYYPSLARHFGPARLWCDV